MPTSARIVPETALWGRTESSSFKVLPGIRGSLIAVFASVAGIDLRFALDPILGTRFPFLISTMAVMVASFFGGLPAGLLAVALSAAADIFLFVSPRYHFGLSAAKDESQIAVFLIGGLVLAVLGSGLRKRRATLRQPE